MSENKTKDEKKIITWKNIANPLLKKQTDYLLDLLVQQSDEDTENTKKPTKKCVLSHVIDKPP